MFDSKCRGETSRPRAAKSELNLAAADQPLSTGERTAAGLDGTQWSDRQLSGTHVKVYYDCRRLCIAAAMFCALEANMCSIWQTFAMVQSKVAKGTVAGVRYSKLCKSRHWAFCIMSAAAGRSC